MTDLTYADRVEAGQALASRLPDWVARSDAVVLALPRGGVPVAAPVARSLRAPLDVLVVRKLGLPGRQELAMGAVAGVAGEVEVVRNEQVLRHAHVSEGVFAQVLKIEQAVLVDRETRYRQHRPAEPVRGRTVVVVDDGLATGASMRAALAALRRQQPSRVVVAVPVGSRDTCRDVSDEVDLVVCPSTPSPFIAVGQAYRDFTQTSDEEVRRALSDVMTERIEQQRLSGERGPADRGPADGGPGEAAP